MGVDEWGEGEDVGAVYDGVAGGDGSESWLLMKPHGADFVFQASAAVMSERATIPVMPANLQSSAARNGSEMRRAAYQLATSNAAANRHGGQTRRSLNSQITATARCT